MAILLLLALTLATAPAGATRVELLDGAAVVEATPTTAPGLYLEIASNVVPLNVRSSHGCWTSGSVGCGGFTNAQVGTAFVGVHPGCSAGSAYRGARCDFTVYPGPGSGVFVAPELLYTYDGRNWPAGACYYVSNAEWQCNYVALTQTGNTVCASRVHWGSSTGGYVRETSLVCLTP